MMCVLSCRWLVCMGLTLLLIVGGCGPGESPPVAPKLPPEIVLFSAVSASVIYGDSVLTTYKVLLADSLKLYPVGTTVTPVDSGAFFVKPVATSTYVLRAYNANGTDSATVAVDITSPVIQALNGLYYEGEMGSTAVNPERRGRTCCRGTRVRT